MSDKPTPLEMANLISESIAKLQLDFEPTDVLYVCKAFIEAAEVIEFYSSQKNAKLMQSVPINGEKEGFGYVWENATTDDGGPDAVRFGLKARQWLEKNGDKK